ncbi:MAG: hypothetical protein EB084_04655 [Proteobacteria bacterium]|nr:hypothetical protein [Pseudomonadota bacterium]
MRISRAVSRLFLALACAAVLMPIPPPRPAAAQGSGIRLSVNKTKVEPGDSYTLTWMESGAVQAVSEFVIEEDADPQFRDKENYSRYVVRSHSKGFENGTAFSHTVRYYRIRARAWVRTADEQQVEDEVVSNTVRVNLLGTDKNLPPGLSDDGDEPVKKPGKDKGKDKDKEKNKDDFPAMGRPDIVVTRIRTEPESVVAGKPFRVHVTVRNAGVVPAPAGQVKIDVAGRQFIGEHESMRPGFYLDVTSPMVMAEKPGSAEIRAVADPFERVDESREDNNSRTITVTVGEAPGKGASPSPAPSSSPGGDAKGGR